MSYEVGSDSISRGSSFDGERPQQPIVPEPEIDQEMSFLDHLEILRWHLVRAVAAILFFTVLAFVSKDILFGIILFGPSKVDFPTYRATCYFAELIGSNALCINTLPFTLQNRTMSGQFSVHITASLIAGLICAFPYVFWEIWRFISPALNMGERNASRGATLAVAALFMAGVLFGYYVVTPLSINFLAGYQIDPSILNEIDIVSYINTVTMLTLACSIMFQLPMVVYFLSRVGFVTPQLMREYRRHAITVILFIAAIITPPDVFSQILVSIPIILLYELSIGLSGRVAKQLAKRQA